MGKPAYTLALTGNPNAGKTSLFNGLTGAHQHVGNYPGVTVEKKSGVVSFEGTTLNIVDLPGTYSLTAYSLEELVARNFLIGERPDVVVDVVDASNLERNLYLAVQLLELGVPLVICLNMMDVAEQRGIKIDLEALSKALNTPVVPTVARKGQGLDQLLEVCVQVAGQHKPWIPLELSYGLDINEALSEVRDILQGREPRQGLISAHWLAVKCLERDTEVMEQLALDEALKQKLQPVMDRVSQHLQRTLDDDPESVIADYRYGYITGITRKAVSSEIEMRVDFSDKVDQVLTNRFFGPLFLLTVLYGIYQFVFWASEVPVGWLEGLFSWLGAGLEAGLPEGVLRSLLVSGVIDGVGGVLGFAPLIMFMFFAIAILEDSGYMARVAYLLDRVLRTFGLHGNSVIGLIVGGGISGGCAVPGIMATRTLKDPQARLATILVIPFMNCGAKLPVYSVLISAFFAGQRAMILFGLTIISWGLALTAAKILRSTLLGGEQAPFVMELPPYRTPTIKGLMIHTWERTWQYVKKAGTIILGVSILIWALMTYPGMPADQAAQYEQRIQQAQTQEAKQELQKEMAQKGLAGTIAGGIGQSLTYLTDPLGFDWRTNVALVGGFAAKEVIVSTLGTAYSLGVVDAEESASLSERLAKEPGWSPLKAFTLMIFVMIYAPCLVTVVMIQRETKSWKWALFSIIYTTASAYVLAFIIYQGGKLLGLG